MGWGRGRMRTDTPMATSRRGDDSALSSRSILYHCIIHGHLAICPDPTSYLLRTNAYDKGRYAS
jgi:hypothetical protein